MPLSVNFLFDVTNCTGKLSVYYNFFFQYFIQYYLNRMFTFKKKKEKGPGGITYSKESNVMMKKNLETK